MKHTSAALLAGAIVLTIIELAVYLFGSFIEANFNISEWHLITRVIIGIIGAAFFIGIVKQTIEQL